MKKYSDWKQFNIADDQLVQQNGLDNAQSEEDNSSLSDQSEYEDKIPQTDKCSCNTPYTSNCVAIRVGVSNLIAGCIPLITASSIWNDVINLAEWFIISIMRMHEYSPDHICMFKIDIFFTFYESLLHCS